MWNAVFREFNTPGILNSVIYYKNGSKKGVSIAEDSLEVMAVGG